MNTINLTLEDIRTLIINAVMTGNQTKPIDIHNAPDECPMEITMACEFVLNQFLNNQLDNKIEELKEDNINNAIKKLLKGSN